MKTVNILGATGSIGQSTFAAVEQMRQEYKIGALVAKSNGEKLAALALQYGAETVAILDESQYEYLVNRLSGSGIKILAGEKGVIEAASHKAEVAVSAIAGFAGLLPTFAAIENSDTLAIANKESVVCAGEFILDKAKKVGAQIIPLDSEHNAIFQIFEEDNKSAIEHLTITASGGALREVPIKALEEATPEMALKHPNWQMGPKVTIDAATLANKGLECIEAALLFDMGIDQIKVAMHPQSIIHGFVHYTDGSVLAHCAHPDMVVPIAYALSYPKRRKLYGYRKLSIPELGVLEFSAPDPARYPMLNLAMASAAEGIESRIVFNTANEIAVAKFLSKDIGFLDIHKTVSLYMEKIKKVPIRSVEDALAFHESIIKAKI